VSTIGHVAAEKSAFNMAQLSRLYEGSGVCAVYMAERVTHQLGMGKTWCMYLHCSLPCSLEAPGEIINLWRSSVCYFEQLVEDGDFEEYQWALMLALCPPHAIRL
jgi:hypothetical protein